jgi:hypothetical protein
LTDQLRPYASDSAAGLRPDGRYGHGPNCAICYRRFAGLTPDRTVIFGSWVFQHRRMESKTSNQSGKPPYLTKEQS